jgi:hypothetical protein
MSPSRKKPRWRRGKGYFVTDRQKKTPEPLHGQPLPYDDRPEFLAAILRFCWNADKAELAEIQKAIQNRETKLRPGRPVARKEIEKLTAQREQILEAKTDQPRSKPSNLDEKTRKELAGIESRIQSLAAKLSKSAKKRGRPRAGEDIDWIAGAQAVMIGRSVLGWTWRQATLASGLTPTKANIRTAQRRQKDLAYLISKGLRLPIESKF